MKYIAILLFALLALPATAAEGVSDLSWTAPETRADGTPLQATEIQEFRIYYGVDVAKPLTKGTEYTAVTGENVAKVTVELTPRLEPYVVSFAVTTVDTNGLESLLSDTVTKEFVAESTSEPNAPTNLLFEFNCITGCTVKEVPVQ